MKGSLVRGEVSSLPRALVRSLVHGDEPVPNQTFLLSEAGDFLLSEAGDYLITE